MPSTSAAGIPTPSPILAAVGKLSGAFADELNEVAESGAFVGALTKRVLDSWADVEGVTEGFAVCDALSVVLDVLLDDVEDVVVTAASLAAVMFK